MPRFFLISLMLAINSIGISFGISRINLSSAYVTLNGFTANVSISGSGNTRMITLSNIQGTAGKKTISIKSGAAENDSGSSLPTPKSVSFTLTEKVVNNSTNNNTNNNNKPQEKEEDEFKEWIDFMDRIGI